MEDDGVATAVPVEEACERVGECVIAGCSVGHVLGGEVGEDVEGGPVRDDDVVTNQSSGFGVEVVGGELDLRIEREGGAAVDQVDDGGVVANDLGDEPGAVAALEEPGAQCGG